MSYGGFANRSAIDAHSGTPPHVVTVGSVLDNDVAISIAFRFDIPPGDTVRFTYLYVLGESAVDDALSCAAEDSDFDGVVDAVDVDDDDDGVPDVLEIPVLGHDPGGDSDGDGVADWRDPDTLPGICADTAPPIGVCDATPALFDTDGDDVPDHLDLDSDGDGLTDALESGGTDADGDGRPDACTGHDAMGGCESAPGVSLLVSSLVDTDGGSEPDLRDLDSDGDGIGDRVEAYDVDGNGFPDSAPTGADHDGDGIDDANDPDCATSTACAAFDAVVTFPLAAFRDADGDGIGDWLEVCGDAYVASTEVCDTGGASETCTARCLRTGMQPCRDDAECDSGICSAETDTCAGCRDTTTGGVDEGCTAARPVCTGTSCEVCDDTASSANVDEGCDAHLPQCDVATRTCGPCTDPIACAPPDAGVDGGRTSGRPVGSGLGCAAGRRPDGRLLAVLALGAALGLARRRRRRSTLGVGQPRARDGACHRPRSRTREEANEARARPGRTERT